MTDCAVICPARLARPAQLRTLSEMTGSLMAQTDDSWHLVLIDDGSPLPGAADAFAQVRRDLGTKVTVLHRPRNCGQGVCRNIGARWAWQRRIPICVYLDDDDRADSRRIETVRRIFRDDPGADFVYSSFALIDEEGRPVRRHLIAPSIKEILDSHEQTPPVGSGAWREIAVDRGYTTLTSTVSVRTWLAVAHPFPDVYVSEDQHAWLRMTAATDGVVFDRSTKGHYRITTDGSGSSVRRRVGAGYYGQKAWVDTQGLVAAVNIALARGRLQPRHVPGLLSAYYDRCAQTLQGEGVFDTTTEYRELARRVAAEPAIAALHCLPVRPALFRPDEAG